MNKSEIAAKLKSSIEEKLYSLGAYVDKELPEYILVMIANKKNKEAMKKDLQLFLGQDTSIFIDWLHDLLGQCQENVENTFRSTKEKNVESSKHSGRHSPEKKKKKERSRGRKERKSDGKKAANKTGVLKNRRSRSRSEKNEESAKKKSEPDEKSARGTPTDAMKGSVDKCITKIISPSKMDSSTTTEEVVAENSVHMVSSVVKVAERPTQVEKSPNASKVFIEKETDQRHMTENKKDVYQKFDQRSSVFSRLGKTDSRLTKLSNRDIEELKEKCHKRIMDREVTEERYTPRRHAERCEPEIKLSLKRSLNRKQFDDETFDNVIDLDKPEKFEKDSESWFKKSKIQSENEEKLSDTSFIVTLKGAERLNLSVKSRLGPKKSLGDIFPSVDDAILEINEELKDNIVQESDDTHKEVIVTAQLGKCKFWPNCKNSEACPFFHPQETCKNFPNCKFGLSCLYVHPNCRFEPNCSKHDCAFTHYQPRISVALKPHGLPGPYGVQRCAYYPNCTNVNCKFFHPNIACKFGLACKAKETCMFYHPSIPNIAELKWVAPSDKDAIIHAEVAAVNAHNSLTEVPSA